MRLQDWEDFLHPYLSKIELLGEIPLEQAGHAELERALGEFVRKHGLREATRRLKEESPAAFVTYLAFKAAFNEERGFWDKVAQIAGLESQQPLFHPTHHWGQIFLEIIESYPNLRRFRGVSGLEYITPIRLHGGIPAASLPDFFQHILSPSMEKAPYDGMNDEAALNALLRRYTAELFVDDVVRYFFQHTGGAGLSFFKKCRQMARQAQTGQPLPAPEVLGLRPYVVQIFENFQVSHSAPAQRRRRPRLYFDPYGPGFRVTLPPQPFSLEEAVQRYEARIYDAETGEVYAAQTRLRPRRQGQDWFLEEVTWVLEEPLQTVQAGLFLQGAETPRDLYPLRLLPPPGYPPLLAFRYEDERQVNLAPALPAQSLWLLYPADAQTAFEGPARLLQSLPPFAPPWQDWKAAAWDLSGVRLLRLLHNDRDICPPISISRPLEPALLPSSLPAHILAVDEKPLYIAPPSVCLPLRNPESALNELETWSLLLESRYAAAPQGEWQARAGELPYAIEGSQAHISLEPWLGRAPFGTYHLALEQRGRLVSELPFRVCTGLSIQGLQPYYLPEGDNAHEIIFTVTLPESAQLHAEDDTRVSSALQEQGKRFTLTIPREASQADLRVHIPSASEFIQIPLRIALPRLRWALALEKGAALAWSHQPISSPLAKLLQSDLVTHRPRLRLELPLTGTEKPLIELRLTTPGVERPLQTSESRALSGQWLEFDLSAFFDTLRAYPEESVFEFQLEWLDAERELNIRLPVLRLSRSLDIHLCHFEATPEGGWRLHWREPHPLHHRRLWLWSRWQPWADPLEIRLPDDAPKSDIGPDDGWWMYDIPEDISLPPSEYRVRFVIVSPYETNPPPDFPPQEAIEIQVITPQSRLWHIENKLANAAPARAFALRFEKLCIYHVEKREEAKQAEIKWCLSHWREASLIHLEALARWLGEYDADENRRAFLMHLFREEVLQRLEEEHHKPPFVQKYLKNVLAARTLRPESARRVIALSNEAEVILSALRMLLKSNADESRHIFWDFLQQGKFSEADAAALLKEHPDFARHLLRDAPPSPARSRLLRELARHLDLPEYVVKAGYYALTDAGWGKIIEIRGAQREDYFFNGEEQPTLLVELLHWAGQKAEIDVKNQRITLPGRNGVNRCACGRFAALGGAATREQWQEHQKICLQKGTSPQPASFTLVSSLIYRAYPPLNPLDTRPGD